MPLAIHTVIHTAIHPVIRMAVRAAIRVVGSARIVMTSRAVRVISPAMSLQFLDVLFVVSLVLISAGFNGIGAAKNSDADGEYD